MKGPLITAEDLDAKFDAVEDMSEPWDWNAAYRPHDFEETGLPGELLSRLAREASKRGTTLKALIQQWLQERLDAAA